MKRHAVADLATFTPPAPALTTVNHVRSNASGVARLLEILPTATVWLIITAPVWGAILAPEGLGFGLLLFSVYWLWKSSSFAAGVAIGYWRLHHAQNRDWLAAAQAV